MMKSYILMMGLVLIAAIPVTHADSTKDQAARPCLSVNVQNETTNRASVQQNCDRNINRTVQAGKNNAAITVQSGDVNDNKIRQYQYDRDKYLQRKLKRK